MVPRNPPIGRLAFPGLFQPTWFVSSARCYLPAVLDKSHRNDTLWKRRRGAPRATEQQVEYSKEVEPYLMLHGVLIFLGLLASLAGLSLAFLSQRYWFARAWRFAGRIDNPGWRTGMRAALLTLLAMIALIAISAIVRNWRGTISRGSWWMPFFGLWMSSSIFSYLFIKIIAGADWLWRRLRSRFSAASHTSAATSVGVETVNHSRRYFFHAAGVLAGAVPFVSAAYGFIGERLRFQVREVEIRIPNLPPGLDGLRITQLSDIHVGSYMPVAQVRRAVGMANELRADLVAVTGDFLTGRTDPLEDCITELSRLRAPMGV